MIPFFGIPKINILQKELHIRCKNKIEKSVLGKIRIKKSLDIQKELNLLI